MSNQFDRHPFDDALTHNAHLKVGGLETPCQATQHAGDCTIYRLRMNGRPYDGICTCGYGWELVRKCDHSEMLSKEWEEEGPGTIKAFKTIMDALPSGLSEWATKAETRIMQLAGIPGIENFSVAVEIQHAIDQACAEKDELRVMQLAAISTASNQNTENTVKDRIGFDHPYCSTAYQDVCRAVDREMALRKACAERDAEIARLKDELRVYEERNSIEINLVADALAKRDLEIVILKADRSALLDGSNVTKLQEQNAALRALLERVPHDNGYEYVSHCHPDCPRCAYEAMKEKP